MAFFLLAFGASAAPAADPQQEDPWLSHGLTAAQREEIRDTLQSGIDRKFVPGGVLLIIHRGEPVFREAFGVADLDPGRRFEVDTPCRIASVTKPHTATLIAILVAQGKLSWDDPIDKYLPDFAGMTVRGKGPAARSPKVRELLSHLSGLASNRALKAGRWKIPFDGTLAEAVASLPEQGLAAEPGSVFGYTRLGYMVAARIAEVVTDEEFASLLQQQLLEPIGATTATFTLSPELQGRMPILYERDAGDFVIRSRFDPDRELAEATYPNPGGGLISTADDVGRLLLLHRNRGVANGERLIPAEVLRELYRPQRETGASGYGLGFNVRKADKQGMGDRIGHRGASGTVAELDFDRDLAIVLLTQVPQRQIGPFRDRLLRTIGSIFEDQDGASP